jgi:hypothetical protein
MNEDPINEETLPESSGTDSEPVLGVTVNSDGSRRRFSEVENRVRRKKSKQKFQKVFFSCTVTPCYLQFWYSQF